jgi:hypothetical protein
MIQNWDFWYANVPSGNPASVCDCSKSGASYAVVALVRILSQLNHIAWRSKQTKTGKKSTVLDDFLAANQGAYVITTIFGDFHLLSAKKLVLIVKTML